MIREPYFTVVVPAYNAQDFIADALRSVLRQAYPHFEIIVVDDCSTDATASIVTKEAARDPRIRLLSMPKPSLGKVARVRNRGIRQAAGDWISFLDADDIWLPHKLEHVVRCIKARPYCSIVHHDQAVVANSPQSNSDQQRSRHYYQKDGYLASLKLPTNSFSGNCFEEAFQRNLFCTSGTSVKHSLLKQSGLFDEALGVAEDYELWLRLLADGAEAAFIPRPLGVYRKHENNISNDNAAMCVAVYQVLKSIEARYPERCLGLSSLAKKQRYSTLFAELGYIERVQQRYAAAAGWYKRAFLTSPQKLGYCTRAAILGVAGCWKSLTCPREDSSITEASLG